MNAILFEKYGITFVRLSKILQMMAVPKNKQQETKVQKADQEKAELRDIEEELHEVRREIMDALGKDTDPPATQDGLR